MKTALVVLALPCLITFPVQSLDGSSLTSECDVRGVYRELDVPVGTMAKTWIGELDEVELVLGPARLANGAYSVTVTRKGSNLYRDDATGLYVVTRNCYEYVDSKSGVLRYESTGTRGGGTLSFER